ncbi:alpha/beta hydrolase [Desertimonas flava]|uniref:alpha/beta hydrolase n=1 Tax=Desertimonas flava TaxID=2064846 RepID=UPI000E347384|nr:alpha/beta hydrolase [Desertimonas flava]
MSDVAPIVLIHGLWMTPLSWEGWAERFRAAGHEVVVPGWPGVGPGPEGVDAVRADPSVLAGLGVKEVADHYETIIRGLDRAPIIMGHSFGGLLTQVLLSRGLGVAGVAIHSAQTRGVMRLPLSTLRAAFPVLKNPLNRGRTVGLTPKQFHYAFTNSLSAEESQGVWDRLHIPAPGRPLFQAGLANFTFGRKWPTSVDYRKADRAPLLFIAGGADHIVPASVNKENAGKYRKAATPAEFREFDGRTHNVVGQAGWEEVADYALSWATSAVGS